MADVTDHWELPYPEDGDVPDVPADFKALAESLDGVAMYSQGTFASRPVSTPGSPGIAGRIYRATDQSILYVDTGTSWEPQIPASAAVLGALGLNFDGATRRGKCITDTEQSTSSTSFTALTTPDKVAGVVVPADGQLLIDYYAWVAGDPGGEVALFIGANQLKTTYPSSGAPVVTAARIGTQADYARVFTSPGGLIRSRIKATGDVDTGQTLGDLATGTLGYSVSLDGVANNALDDGAATLWPAGSTLKVFGLPAGTYDVSVRYKAYIAGTIKAKNRKLWVCATGF